MYYDYDIDGLNGNLNVAGLDGTAGEKKDPERQKHSRKQKRNKGFGRKAIAFVLSAALFGGIAGGAFYGVGTLFSDSDASSSAETEATSAVTTVSYDSSSDSDSSQSLDVTEIAASGLTSVVSVTNISVQEVENYVGMFGRGGSSEVLTEETTSCGSGVIIYADDSYVYMVTNYHVVEGATTLSVTFVDDATYEAELCGYDEDSDIAVIKVSLLEISEDTLSSISVAAIGDSDDLEVGEQVVAIGNALGYGQSVTTGIVSAVDRTISSEDSSVSYIQTDAAINPGNSGGALFNMDGELIGINTAKVSSTDVEGMGYAIPISDILDLIASFIGVDTLEEEDVSIAEEVSL